MWGFPGYNHQVGEVGGSAWWQLLSSYNHHMVMVWGYTVSPSCNMGAFICIQYVLLHLTHRKAHRCLLKIIGSIYIVPQPCVVSSLVIIHKLYFLSSVFSNNIFTKQFRKKSIAHNLFVYMAYLNSLWKQGSI